MANLKISELSDGGVALGTDETPTARAGANKKEALSALRTYCRQYLEALMTSNLFSSSIRDAGQANNVIRTAAGVWYFFYVNNTDNDLYYIKSSNYGVSWGPAVTVRTGTVFAVATWFDKETPADSGTVIHIAYMDSGSNTVYYRALDTSGDSLGTEIVVFAGASLVSGATPLAVMKSRGAKILVGFDGDGGTETGFYKSNDYPVTAFTSKSNSLNEAAADYFLLFPGNYADSNDIDAVFWDRSADELSLKTYDDSADNWTGVSAETSISTGMVDIASNVAAPNFSGVVRSSNGHLFLIAWNNNDLLNADLKCWEINGAGSITARTDVVTDSVDDQGLCGLQIDSSNNLIAFYGGKSDGSETAYSSLNIYYKISTDSGVTWGAETLLTTFARSFSHLHVARLSGVGEYALEFGNAGTGYTIAWT